jgi:type IV secretory pathway VirB10-like protein
LGLSLAWRVGVAVAAALLVGTSLWALRTPAPPSAVVAPPRAAEIAAVAPVPSPPAPIPAPRPAAEPTSPPPTPAAVVEEPNVPAAHEPPRDEASFASPFEDPRIAKPARGNRSRKASGTGPRAGRLSASDF